MKTPFRLSCKEASRLISEGMDRRLSFGERILLGLHVRVCDACSRFTKHLAFLSRALNALPSSNGPERR